MKYEEGKPILDPRAFLWGESKLWENQRPGDNQPVMYGRIMIPTRLIDFVYDNSVPHYMIGERAISFSISYWEAPEQYYRHNPALYDGKVGIYVPKLVPDLQDPMRKAYKYQSQK